MPAASPSARHALPGRRKSDTLGPIHARTAVRRRGRCMIEATDDRAEHGDLGVLPAAHGRNVMPMSGRADDGRLPNLYSRIALWISPQPLAYVISGSAMSGSQR